MNIVKGFLVDIYRSNGYDCEINAMHCKTEVTVVDNRLPEMFTASEDLPAVRLVVRNINGAEYIHAEPYKSGSYAFGGSFIYTSDSRFRDISDYPIPLHDRQMNLERS